MTKAIYPGTFDPITNGHLDIIKRSAAIFDEVIVVIMRNVHKQCLFSEVDRQQMIETCISNLDNVTCIIDDGLAVNCARKHGAKVMIRGIREVQDYEYEVRIAATNAWLDQEIETMFLLSNPNYSFISSSAVREIALYSDDLQHFVPDHVAAKLKANLHK